MSYLNDLEDFDNIRVHWRGEEHVLWTSERLIIHRAGPTGGSVCLWAPTSDPSLPYIRLGWIADVFIRGLGFVEGAGATAQEALDALDAALPTWGPMVRGGSC